MKVFEVQEGIVSFYHPEYASSEEAYLYFARNILFIDAPDYVFEGWGYDSEAEGDARFIKPTPPDGWLYDDETGTFYPENELPPSDRPSYESLLTMYSAIERGLTT